MPIINTSILQEFVAAQKIQWISLDTNIFIAFEQDIKRSNLVDIKKISNKVGFVLPSIIKDELIKKYIEKNTDKLISFKKNYSNIKYLLNQSMCTNLDKILELDLYESIKGVFDSFFNDTSCLIYYPKDGIDIKEIFNLYFDSTPPFENSKNKKCEFPDAAMLICLEHFTEEHQTGLLLLTCDKGCIEYAKESDNIFVLDDLTKNAKNLFLSTINSLSFDKYNFLTEKFKNYTLTDTNYSASILNSIRDLLTDSSNFELNLISAYYCDGEIEDITFPDIDIKDIQFHITSIKYNKINITFSLEIPIQAYVYYKTYIKDYIDDDLIVTNKSTVCIEDTASIEIEHSVLLETNETDTYFDILDSNIIFMKKYIDVEIDRLFNEDDYIDDTEEYRDEYNTE